MDLLLKRILYIERYTKVLAPEWVLARDPYLVRNVFPAEVAARVAELGLTLPA